MSLNIIPLTLAEIPTSFTADIDDTGNIYRYYVEYNDLYDFFTMSVLNDSTGETLYSSRIVYGNDILHAGHITLGLTNKIVPVDLDGVYNVVNKETFDNISFVVG